MGQLKENEEKRKFYQNTVLDSFSVGVSQLRSLHLVIAARLIDGIVSYLTYYNQSSISKLHLCYLTIRRLYY